jgi:hypothetical protein
VDLEKFDDGLPVLLHLVSIVQDDLLQKFLISAFLVILPARLE